jgi:uncharacterized protein (DUF924 family)
MIETRLAQVHRYWFDDSDSDLEVIARKGKIWFGKDELVDRYIRDRFSDLIESAAHRQIETAGLKPQLRLAVILLLDQFTRNIYRNDPRSFASDPLARTMARDLLACSAERLRPIEKVFLYLPLEHSEDLVDQEDSVALFYQLHDSAAENLREAFGGFLDYALRHRDIIARFGRFPHRNKILGRNSTAEEIEFLSQPGSSF